MFWLRGLGGVLQNSSENLVNDHRHNRFCLVHREECYGWIPIQNFGEEPLGSHSTIERRRSKDRGNKGESIKASREQCSGEAAVGFEANST